MLVFDATPLIYLAKTDSLRFVQHLEEKKVIPESVYDEVIIEDKPDARTIEKLVEEDVFNVREVEKDEFYSRLNQNPSISDADAAVLTLAKKEKGTAVMDETYGRKIADVEDVKNRGTIYLLFELLKHEKLTEEEVRETVDSMIDEGWYCSTDLYSKIISKLEQIG